MKQIRLLSLTLKNFKGIRNFTLSPGGLNINVFGDNAAGKTTLFDAFLWLMFDKDSQNKKDFQIKTLDANGNVLNGLDHEVEGAFEINGKQLTLRKVYAEKWTKQRGSATAQFTGHTTDYYINGVPSKKNEFTSQIAEIVDENIFKLLTSPTYFNEQLHWQERRKILLSVAGEITDEEVIASDKSLTALNEILLGRSLEDHRKIITAKRSDINKELEKIPVRIDEVQRSLPDITNLNKEQLIQQIQFIKGAITGKEQQISRLENGAEITKKQKEILELESDLLTTINTLNAKVNEQIAKKRELLSQAKGEQSDLQVQISGLNREIEGNQRNITRYEADIADLRAKWHEVSKREFTFDQSDKCPVCEQSLPAEKLQDARDKALASFNLTKSSEIEKINQRGKELSDDVKQYKAVNELFVQKIEQLQSDLKAKEEEITKLQAEITALSENIKNPADSKEYQQRLAVKHQLDSEIAEIKANQKSSIDKVKLQIMDEQQRLNELQIDLNKFDQYQYGQKRIEELLQQEKQLATEFEKLEGELYLTEQFIRTKVSLLEEKINNRFKFARFKLFDVQVNGGLSETCETLYQGVPYSGGLNNAARINVGLDIINTLSEHYGYEVPIFIDNSEAVTRLIDTKGQLIRLIVSEQDKQLRVESKHDEGEILL